MAAVFDLFCPFLAYSYIQIMSLARVLESIIIFLSKQLGAGRGYDWVRWVVGWELQLVQKGERKKSQEKQGFDKSKRGLNYHKGLLRGAKGIKGKGQVKGELREDRREQTVMVRGGLMDGGKGGGINPAFLQSKYL